MGTTGVILYLADHGYQQPLGTVSYLQWRIHDLKKKGGGGEGEGVNGDFQIDRFCVEFYITKC